MPPIYEQSGCHIEFWDKDKPVATDADVVHNNLREQMAMSGDYNHGTGVAVYPGGWERNVDVFTPSGEPLKTIDTAAQAAARQIGAETIIIAHHFDGLERFA